MTIAALAGPGGVRRLAAHWVITADLRLETAARLGGDAAPGDPADMVVIRDRATGSPLLPGATLAGALRAHLADRLGGYGSPEDERVRSLFGARRTDVEADAHDSRLIVFDALAHPQTPIEIRDGVSIDSATGTAKKHAYYDLEVLPAGAVFEVRFDLQVPETASESDLLDLAETALSGLAPGEICLGARRSRGFGQLKAVSWRARRYSLSDVDGWCTWLLSDADDPLLEVEPRETVRGAVRAGGRLDKSNGAIPDRRLRAFIKARVHIDGGLLVGSPGSAPDDPDSVHLTSGGKPVLPGTSLAGVMRTRATKIARLLLPRPQADRLVDSLFGWLGDETRPTGDAVAGPEQTTVPAVRRHRRHTAVASRLRVRETFIEKPRPETVTRIRIDRATQGVDRGALFTERPLQRGNLDVAVELRNPQPGEIGLLLLVVRDLIDGDLPVGGTVAVGRGVLRGTATITFPDRESLSLDDPASTERLQQEIRQLGALQEVTS